MTSYERWTRWVDGRVVHADSDEHVALVARTLGIDESAWDKTLDGYARGVSAASSVDQRLQALGAAFRAVAPHESPLEPRAPATCVCCGEPRSAPAVARRA